MTHNPPPANESGHGHADDARKRRADTAPASQQPLSPPATKPPVDALSLPICFASSPFAWQHGAHLYLLVSEWRGWVLAEMEFVPSLCHYVEIRRTSYRWPREAVCVLLTRSLDADDESIWQLADDVTTWMTTSSHPMSLLPPELSH
jgi:hypothetical protein